MGGYRIQGKTVVTLGGSRGVGSRPRPFFLDWTPFSYQTLSYNVGCGMGNMSSLVTELWVC